MTDQHNNAPAVPVAWWIPKAEQFCLAKPSGERPFAKAWEPLYAAAPAVPQGIPAQEVIDAIEAWKSAWLKVPPFADRVNKATREAITISHNSLFLLLQSAQQAQRMPDGCPTPTGCGPHGCHGACIAATPAPAQEVPSDPNGWCQYVAGMVFGWLQMQEGLGLTSYDEDRFVEAIAGIVQRRLWAYKPAQEVSDKHEREMLEVIDERDRINEWADQLADAIAKHTGYEIGEHTSENNPWRMALNALVCHEAKQEVGLTDDERQQVFRDAENRMVREINLSWRTAVVDEVISALRAKGASDA